MLRKASAVHKLLIPGRRGKSRTNGPTGALNAEGGQRTLRRLGRARRSPRPTVRSRRIA